METKFKFEIDSDMCLKFSLDRLNFEFNPFILIEMLILELYTMKLRLSLETGLTILLLQISTFYKNSQQF